MCWSYYKYIDKKKRIAETDIRTFKILKSVEQILCAYYQNYKYTIGKLNSVNSLELIRNKIFEGFHSYDLNNDCLSALGGIVVQGKEGGFLDYFSRADHIVKVECTIPKGSEYYENSLGEIVSNKLIVDKIIFKF